MLSISRKSVYRRNSPSLRRLTRNYDWEIDEHGALRPIINPAKVGNLNFYFWNRAEFWSIVPDQKKKEKFKNFSRDFGASSSYFSGGKSHKKLCKRLIHSWNDNEQLQSAQNPGRSSGSWGRSVGSGDYDHFWYYFWFSSEYWIFSIYSHSLKLFLKILRFKKNWNKKIFFFSNFFNLKKNWKF